MMSDNITNQRSSVVKTLVVLSILVVIMFVLQLFVWRWVKYRSMVLHELRIQAQQIEEVGKRTKEMQAGYDNQKVFIAQLDSVTPQSRNAVQVIERLETVTQGLNLQLEVSRIDTGVALKAGEKATMAAGAEQTSPAQEAAGEQANWILPLFITVDVRGRPEALIKYIDAVEHVQELSYIQKFTISSAPVKAGVGENTTDSDFQLVMTVVFYLQGKPDGSING